MTPIHTIKYRSTSSCNENMQWHECNKHNYLFI
jgi:hypothetical protein